MALRSWASKTASFLRISTFQRGFASEVNKKKCMVLLGDKHVKVFQYQAASHLRFSVFHRGFASVVKDLKYADTHEWVKVEGNSAIAGITDHAQDHLGDVVYVELPEVGASVTQGNSFGAVESVKATSDINSPISGKVVEVNEELNDSPGLVNGSPYENGWIMKVELSNNDELNSLMDSDKYSKFCEEEDAKHQ